jgi:hypothetical protein
MQLAVQKIKQQYLHLLAGGSAFSCFFVSTSFC